MDHLETLQNKTLILHLDDDKVSSKNIYYLKRYKHSNQDQLH